MRRIHLIPLSLILVILIGFTWARRPAVEPVKGISIDEYKPVPPTSARGFDFTQGKAKPLVPSKESSSSSPWALFAILGIFPMAISLLIVKKLKRPEEMAEPISLEAHRAKKEDEKDWKKAS